MARVVRLVELVEDATERDGSRVGMSREALLVDLAEASVELDELEVVGRRLDALLEDAARAPAHASIDR